jgi:hypothetical protein
MIALSIGLVRKLDPQNVGSSANQLPVILTIDRTSRFPACVFKPPKLSPDLFDQVFATG